MFKVVLRCWGVTPGAYGFDGRKSRSGQHNRAFRRCLTCEMQIQASRRLIIRLFGRSHRRSGKATENAKGGVKYTGSLSGLGILVNDKTCNRISCWSGKKNRNPQLAQLAGKASRAMGEQLSAEIKGEERGSAVNYMLCDKRELNSDLCLTLKGGGSMTNKCTFISRAEIIAGAPREVRYSWRRVKALPTQPKRLSPLAI